MSSQRSCWSLLIGLLVVGNVVAQNVRELVGHQGPVTGVAYSPDGSRIASSSFDAVARLWDVAAGTEIKSIPAAGQPLLSVAYAPSGRAVLLGSRDRAVRWWNIAAEDPVKLVGPLAGDIQRLAVSPDGRCLAVGSPDGSIRLVDIVTGGVSAEFSAHAGGTTAWSFLPDSSLATVGADQMLRVWKTPAGEPLAWADAGPTPITHLAAAPDGSRLVSADSAGQLRAWRLPIGESRSLAGHAGDVVRLLRAGGLLVSLGSDQTIHIHDAATGEERRVISSPAPIRDWTLPASDPNLLITACEDKTLRVWSLADGTLTGVRTDLLEAATAVSISADGKTIALGEANGMVRTLAYPFVYEFDERAIAAHVGVMTSAQRSGKSGWIVTAGQDTTVRLWDAQGSAIRAFALTSPVRHCVLAGSEDRLAAVGADNVLRVWAVNGAELKVLPNVTGAIAFSSDGKWLAAAGADNKVSLYPADFSAEPKAVASHGGPVRGIVFHPAGTQVFSAGQDNVVKVADVASGAEVKTLTGHAGPVTCLAVSDDGKSLVSGSDDKTVKVWNVEAGTVMVDLTNLPSPVIAVATTPDGSAVAVALADNQVHVYRQGALRASIPVPGATSLAFVGDHRQLSATSADGKLRFLSERAPRIVGQHGAAVRSIAFSPDGQTILSASDDTLVRTWETATGKSLRGLAHGSAATHVVATPDGSKWISAEVGGKLRIWESASGAPSTLVELGSATENLSLAPDGASVLAATAGGSVRWIRVDGVELDRHRVEGVRAAALVDLSGTVAVAGKEKLLAIRSATSDWRIPVGAVTGLAVTGSGQIVTTSADGQLASRQLADGATASSVATPAPVGLSLTGTRVLVWSADQTFRSYDLSSAEPLLKEFPASTSATAAVLWGGDERSAVRVLTDGKLEFWSLEAPAGPTATLATPAPLNAASSLGSRVVAVAGGDKVVRFFEPPPAPVMDFAGHEDQVFSVAFAPDGGFASGGGDYSVRLWSATESQAIASLKGHASLVYSVAFHPGGQVVASAGGDRTVILWNRADGRELRRLAGAEGVLYQTAFVEGGAKVLAGGVDRKLRLWETETGALIKTMEGQPDEIYGLAVNTAGTRWATSGIQGNVLVWDAATGQVVFSHKLPAGAYSVAYRPDGTQIAVGSADHKIYVIDLPEAAR